MALLGLQANYDGKDPYSKTIPEDFLVVNPWRPAGSGSSQEMAQYDRNGVIVFIPSGIYPAHCTNVGGVPLPFGSQGFDYITRALRASLAEATPNRINAFSAYFHPDDFGPSEANQPGLYAWESWLSEIVDPLVADGRVRWSTFIEIARAYQEWEEVNVPTNKY
jgi:hypothetical protein